jgi:hypothetical protein
LWRVEVKTRIIRHLPRVRARVLVDGDVLRKRPADSFPVDRSTAMTGVAMGTFGVLVLLAFGLGTAGLGWLLQHAGESVDHPSNTNGFRGAVGLLLMALGFLIGGAGPIMALHAADPPKPPTVYQDPYK